jgi:hypothetical protein
VETEFEQIRYQLQEKRAKLLTKTFPSAKALGLVKVRDIMWMYTGRDIYRMLVLERGWSSDEYEDWLANTLISSLTTSRDSNVKNSTASRLARRSVQSRHKDDMHGKD